MGDELLNKVEELRVIPVVTLPNAECAKPLADALREGGIACAEITFRTASAEAGLRALGRIADKLDPQRCPVIRNTKDLTRRLFGVGAQHRAEPFVHSGE